MNDRIKTALELWHLQLRPKGDYYNLDLVDVYDCLSFAKHLREKLKPELTSIIMFEDTANGIFPSSLDLNSPWIRHYVLVKDNLVLDPALGRPCNLEQYTYKMFRRPLNYKKLPL
jgi:hypothetical protein